MRLLKIMLSYTLAATSGILFIAGVAILTER